VYVAKIERTNVSNQKRK